MNKLSKEKRNQLILTCAGIALVLLGIYFTLIQYQQRNLKLWSARKLATNNKLSEIRNYIKNSREIEAELVMVSNKLAVLEEDMPTGDIYASMVNSIRKFKLGRKIDIPQFNSPGNPTDMTLLPKFPYKQVMMTIIGTGFYQDLGKFVADFENEYPSCRIVSLDLSPASAQSPEDREKLTFKMDIASLIKASPVSETSSKL